MNRRPPLVDEYLKRALSDASPTPRQVVFRLAGRVHRKRAPYLMFREDWWFELDRVEYGFEGVLGFETGPLQAVEMGEELRGSRSGALRCTAMES